MTERTRVSSGTKWESFVGYSRAVRVDRTIEVSGTVAVDAAGVIVGKADPYQQTRFILSKIEGALHQLGATLQDVVRTRIYITEIALWEEVGRAHGEVFGKIRPASTMLEVSSLVDPDYLVEIEAAAHIALAT